MKKEIRVIFNVIADISETEKDYVLTLPKNLSKFLKSEFKYCSVRFQDEIKSRV